MGSCNFRAAYTMRFLPLHTFLNDQPSARVETIDIAARPRSSVGPGGSGTIARREPCTAQQVGQTVRQLRPGVKAA
jgi:hypothetical protein